MSKHKTAAALMLLRCLTVIATFFGCTEDKPPISQISGKTEYISRPTTQPTTPTEPEWAYYYLTPAERDTVERVVMAEAGGESLLGQMAVAQCVLNACYADGIRPGRAVIDYAYASSRPDPTEQVKAAVSAVFDEGCMAVAEDILYFYAPARVSGEGHERRHEYVCTIGGHKFFKEKER